MQNCETGNQGNGMLDVTVIKTKQKNGYLKEIQEDIIKATNPKATIICERVDAWVTLISTYRMCSKG